MSARLARSAGAHPRRSGLIAAAVFVLVAVIGSAAPGSFDVSRAFDDPGSDSTAARDRIEAASGESAEAAVVAIVSGGPGSAHVESVARMIRAVPGIAKVTEPPVRGASPLGRGHGAGGLVTATLLASASEDDVSEALMDRFADDEGVVLGGNAIAGTEVGEQATSDLATAELLALPLLIALMLLFFRGIGALLPLAVGATTVLGTFALLRGVNGFLAISPFALNLVIGMGLGLAVDYSLLTVTRFREELGAGADPPAALAATLRSAGHTVLFSAVTVGAALACLTVFPQRFLISMGIGGALVALVAAAATFLVLPPLLILLARRIGKVVPGPEREGRWYRLAHWVMGRPAVVAAGSALLMLVLAAPTLGLHWTGVDATSLPSGQSARTAFEDAREFPGANVSPLFAAVEAPAGAGARVGAYARALDQVETARAGKPRYLGDGTWRVEVNAPGAPSSSTVQGVVGELRAVPAPFPATVGGSAAELKDSQAAVAAKVPLALVLLVVLTCTALWLMTGSVVLPIKALLMNLLTLAAATGIVVFVFQEGNLAGLFGASAQGGVEQTDYLVLAAIVFGLSTDYGVFLLTRIKEVRDGGATDDEAIALGLQHTGGVVSAAAVLLAIAIGAFVTSGMVFLKELGLGAAAAVLLDAFVVRSLLVPSLMKLLGAANWWSPRPLRRLHRRIGPSGRTYERSPFPI